MKLAVGVVRASTDEQQLSPHAQRAALERYCAANGVKLVAVFEDLGISGAAVPEKRPGLMAALAALDEHGAGLLLVHKRDRLARDAMIAALITRLVEKRGAKVITAEGVSNGTRIHSCGMPVSPHALTA